MAFPTITVELAVTTDPTQTPTWTDVSAYVRAIPDIESATRKDELGRRWEAGKATIVFDNSDGRFDPGNTAGAYYPNLLPLRRIRILANYNSIDYPLFSGYVDTWTPEWTLPGESWVAIRCTDASLVWANTSMPGSVHEVEVRALEPEAWLRLGDAAADTGIDSSGNGHHVTYEGDVSSAAGLVYGDSDAGATFAPSARGTFPTGSQVLDDFGFTICAWIQVDDAVPNNATIFAQQADANPGGAYDIVFFGYFAVGGEAFLQASGVVNDNVASFIRTDTDPLGAGVPHHVACVFPAVGAALPAELKLYVDGVAVTGTASAVSYATMPAFPTSMIYSSIANGPDGIPAVGGNVDGILDEVQIYTRVLTPTEIAGLASAGSEPWGDELSGARVTHAFDACGWPAADRDIDTGSSTLQRTDLTGSLLSYLQNIADSENGAIYATAEGEARFRGRHTLLTTARHATSQKMFSDTPGVGELDYVDVALEQREQLIRNRIRFKRTGGTVHQVDDTSSQSKFFVRAHPSATGATELQVASDLEVIDAATWYLAHFKDATEAFTKVVLEPYGNEDDQYPQMLGRLLEDRITVETTPVGSAQRSQETLIVGIHHEIPEVGRWRTTFSLSPADTQSYLVLDDAVAGQLDGNALAY